MKWIFALAAILVIAACQPLPKDIANSNLPISRLAFDGGAWQVVVEDFDGNNLLDILFTSHSGSYSQIFFQRAVRRFEAGPRLDQVGFHPGDLVPLQGTPRRYLMAAEGEGSLRVMQPDTRAGLRVLSQRPFPSPRYLAPFDWPKWGRAVAVVGVQYPYVYLLKGSIVDPKASLDIVEVRPGPSDPKSRYPQELLVADLDRDGVSEIYYSSYLTDAVWRIAPSSDGSSPVPQLLWRFNNVAAPKHLLALDVDGDGAPELVVPQEAAQKVAIFKVVPNGKLRQLVEIALPAKGGPYAAAGGVDADGDVLLATGVQDYLLLHRLSSGGTRSEYVAIPTITWPSQLAMTDIDGDGHLDLLVGIRSPGFKAALIYGPLWDAMGQLSRAQYKIQ
jgi:hypothetical protein